MSANVTDIYSPSDPKLETFFAVQKDITARLQNDEFIKNVYCQSERKKDIVSDVTKALGVLPQNGQRGGIAIVVQAAVGDIVTPNVTDPQTKCRYAIRVMENPLFNDDLKTGLGIPALVLVRRIIQVIHLYRPMGLAQNLLVDNPAWLSVEDPIAPVAYEVYISCMEEGLRTRKVSLPQMTNASGTITLTSSEGGDIYSTVDGSYPGPFNPASRKYSEPFQVGSALTLRWMAVKKDSIDSDTGILRT